MRQQIYLRKYSTTWSVGENLWKNGLNFRDSVLRTARPHRWIGYFRKKRVNQFTVFVSRIIASTVDGPFTLASEVINRKVYAMFSNSALPFPLIRYHTLLKSLMN